MKSLVEEASSVVKAIEKAWNRAGNPQTFSVKVFETPETNFFGFTKKSAKVGIFFEEEPAPQVKKYASTNRDQRPKPRDREVAPAHQNRDRRVKDDSQSSAPRPQHNNQRQNPAQNNMRRAPLQADDENDQLQVVAPTARPERNDARPQQRPDRNQNRNEGGRYQDRRTTAPRQAPVEQELPHRDETHISSEAKNALHEPYHLVETPIQERSERRDNRGPRDTRAPRDNRDREPREFREPRELRDHRDTRDNEEQPQDIREPRENRDREPRDDRDRRPRSNDRRDSRGGDRRDNRRDSRDGGRDRDRRGGSYQDRNKDLRNDERTFAQSESQHENNVSHSDNVTPSAPQIVTTPSLAPVKKVLKVSGRRYSAPVKTDTNDDSKE